MEYSFTAMSSVILFWPFSILRLVILISSCLYVIPEAFTANSTAILVHALVPSRIDYCNTVLSDLSNKIFHSLQLVHNGAVLVITRTPSVEDITPVLQQPYWLTVKYHINFKFRHLTFKYPYKAPHFFDILHIATPSHTLRSSCAVTFIIPPDRLTTMDIRAFI